jgi:hypothetical protein
MRLLRWFTAGAVVAALVASSPAAADAQTCSGSKFATCATVVVAPVALGVALLSFADVPNPQDLAFFAEADKNSVNANDGCPSPNGENGAVSVNTHNPHCNGGAADVDPTVAPEPASIVLLGTALLTLGAGLKSRRKTA